MDPLTFVANHEMASLEPNAWYTDSSSANLVLLRSVCPTLVEIDENLELAPGLAMEWSVSPDHRTFRFLLHPDLVMHDGTPLTSELVRWNFDRLRDPRVNSSSAWDFRLLAGIDCPDPRTVEFQFRSGFPTFPYHLPWSAHLTSDRLIQPIGAGPFRVERWRRGEDLLLRPFERYFREGLPKADTIRIVFEPDANERLERIETGDGDIFEGVSAASAEDFSARGLLNTSVARSPRQALVAFNCASHPFDDVRVRRAVAHAIDREAVRRAVWGDFAQPLEGLFPADSPWYADLESYAFDPQRARALLHEAGHDSLTIARGVMTAVSPMPKVAELICSYLADVGIGVTVTGYDDPPWYPFIYGGYDWQIAFQNFPPRAHPETFFSRDYGTGGPLNMFHYSNPELDALLDRARGVADFDGQYEHYSRAQQILRDDLPVLPICAPDVASGARPSIAGYRPHPLQYVDLESVHRV